jgi:hypothetical protein
MKRRGSEYVAKLLLGKSRKEQLDFWIKRTEILLSKHQQNIKKMNNIIQTDKPQLSNVQL